MITFAVSLLITDAYPAKSATLAGCCRPGSLQSLRPGVQMSARDGSCIPVYLLPIRLRHLWPLPPAIGWPWSSRLPKWLMIWWRASNYRSSHRICRRLHVIEQRVHDVKSHRFSNICMSLLWLDRVMLEKSSASILMEMCNSVSCGSGLEISFLLMEALQLPAD